MGGKTQSGEKVQGKGRQAMRAPATTTEPSPPEPSSPLSRAPAMRDCASGASGASGTLATSTVATLVVDLVAVADNWRRLQARVGPATCAAVVKADAYGLGAGPVATALWAAGCREFFVAHLEEGIALRAALPEAGIACLGGLLPGMAAAYRAARITPVLNHLGEIALWRQHCAATELAQPAMIHLDTGMNRLGLGDDERQRLAAEPERLAGIPVLAWLSHLACADVPAHPLNVRQRDGFARALGSLPPAPRSLANSSGIYLGREWHFDLVRPGCALYGINPTPEAANPLAGVVQVLAPILQVRTVRPGAIDSPATVGYGAAHPITRPTRIATLGIGYADGYLRSLGGQGQVWINGQPAAVVGRVSMDLVTVDVSGIGGFPEPEAMVGHLATVLGPPRPVDQVAAEAGTIGYEILTALGRRYHRRYWPEPEAAL